MLLIWNKEAGFLEVVHHSIGASLGASHKNIIIGIKLLNAFKVDDKEIFKG